MQRNVKGIVVLSGVIFGLLVGSGYLFREMYGVVRLGYAWVVGSGVGVAVETFYYFLVTRVCLM